MSKSAGRQKIKRPTPGQAHGPLSQSRGSGWSPGLQGDGSIQALIPASDFCTFSPQPCCSCRLTNLPVKNVYYVECRWFIDKGRAVSLFRWNYFRKMLTLEFILSNKLSALWVTSFFFKNSQRTITLKTLFHASLLQTASLSRLCVYVRWLGLTCTGIMTEKWNEFQQITKDAVSKDWWDS